MMRRANMHAQVRASGRNELRLVAAWRSRPAQLAFLLALSVVALLPASPYLYRTPNTDSSAFFYVGQEMVRGEMLYRDVYDHKPPLIFLINAAGVMLGGGGDGTAGGGRWGVWALELVSLAAAVILAFLTLERYFGRLPALVALGAALVNLAFVHERGNLTEEYAYPFQFGALFLLASSSSGASGRTAPPAGRFFAIGLLLGLASSLKQNMAGIGAAIVVYLVFEFYERRGDLFRRLFWLAAGAAAVWLVWFAIFAGLGVLPEFWEAAFLLNFSHSSHSTPERLQTLVEAFHWLTGSSGFFLGGMLIWLTVVPYLILYDNRVLPILSGHLAGAGISGLGLLLLYNGLFRSGLDLYAFTDLSPYRYGLLAVGAVLVGSGALFLSGWAGGRIQRLADPWRSPAGQAQPERSDLALPLIVALVDLPVALGLAILTGNNFPHYFMPLIPSLVILFAYGVHLLLRAAGIENAAAGRSLSSTTAPAVSPHARLGLAYTWLAALMLPVIVPGIQMTFEQLHPRGDRQVEDTAAYLASNTLPGEPVLQWGIAPSVYILSNRSASARYFYTNPLFFDGYSGEWQTSRMLADLQAQPPVLIVDTMMVRLPLITAPNWQDCDQVQDPAYYQAFLESRQGPAERIPQFPAGIGDVYQWICQNYRPVGSVGELDWQVYRFKGK